MGYTYPGARHGSACDQLRHSCAPLQKSSCLHDLPFIATGAYCPVRCSLSLRRGNIDSPTMARWAPLLTALTLLIASSPATALQQPQVVPSNPFCGISTSRNAVTIGLRCATGVIDSLAFASYGTPEVVPGSCAGYAVNASCNDPSFYALAVSTCVNKTECVLTRQQGDFDPCPEVVKSIAVVATCSGSAGGGYTVIPFAACTLDAPCPAPQWQPTYQMNRSTICQPGNTVGYLNATEAARWGLVSLDW
jgi:hypothetical protein